LLHSAAEAAADATEQAKKLIKLGVRRLVSSFIFYHFLNVIRMFRV